VKNQGSATKVATDVPRNHLTGQFSSAMFFERVGSLEFGRFRSVGVSAKRPTHKEGWRAAPRD